MAKKSAKKVISRGSKGVKSAKKTTAKASAKGGSPTVNVGLYGMAKIVKMVHEAGLESDLNDTLGSKGKDKVVKVDRRSFNKIRNFVGSKPELANHPLARELSACDPDDPYDICFGQHSSFGS
jgi:hypothetical protein